MWIINQPQTMVDPDVSGTNMSPYSSIISPSFVDYIFSIMSYELYKYQNKKYWGSDPPFILYTNKLPFHC